MTDDIGGTDYDVDDDDQLQPEDTLEQLGVDDVLDEGYSPPDREPWAVRQGLLDGQETLDQRLAEEEPDISEFDPVAPLAGSAGARAGRLVAPDEGVGEDSESELLASDVGIDGAAASAEEAAVHYVDEGAE
ncbi:hypothetical protein HH308_14920 [Gordonia sp. TBRC 11910]|uniref:DUF5709 domain-containing protein n=1 Tax=Gordonia asplenii TaxID=2725283 RepID=A0A848KV18_9ACTN|nr:DUF5709 domain-containing protein [Gordonia asplenii]NMO02506.1 hypothetical protein [Gordonia asplenii]